MPPHVCIVTVEAVDHHALLQEILSVLPLHAVEGCVGGVVEITSDVSGSFEAFVALGDFVGWYFESAGIIPPFFLYASESGKEKKHEAGGSSSTNPFE